MVHLAKWLSVRLRTKWFWVRVQLQSFKLQISRLLRARSSLTFNYSVWTHFETRTSHDKNIQTLCGFSKDIESITHFFFHRNNFHISRQILFEDIRKRVLAKLPQRKIPPPALVLTLILNQTLTLTGGQFSRHLEKGNSNVSLWQP